MNLIKFLCLSGSAAVSTVGALAAGGLVIDSYNTYTTPTASNVGFNLVSAGTAETDTDAIPGSDSSFSNVSRLVTLDPNGDGASAKNNAGFINLSNDLGVLSTLKFEYSIGNVTPGSGADISSGTAFTFLLVATDSTVTYDITITDRSLDARSVTGVAAPVLPGVFNVLFSSLSSNINFDPTDVTKIVFQINAGSSADVGIDAFGIDLPAVPESSTYAAVGFMSIAAFGAYRRVRK